MHIVYDKHLQDSSTPWSDKRPLLGTVHKVIFAFNQERKSGQDNNIIDKGGQMETNQGD